VSHRGPYGPIDRLSEEQVATVRCATCSTPVQSYFDRTEHLRCAVCFPGTATQMDVSPRRWGGNPDGLPIRIMFEKHVEHAVDAVVWRPVPCIDPSVDTRMAALLRSERLGGCFVKPPHLHGHHVLGEGETIAERCPTGRCTWSVAQAPHRCGIMCYAVGCKLGGIDPPPPRGLNPDRRPREGGLAGLASGFAIEAAEAERDRRAAVDAERARRVSDATAAMILAEYDDAMRRAEEMLWRWAHGRMR
jgi:hypothetical protein